MLFPSMETKENSMNKKIIKFISFLLIIVFSSTILASCGKDAWKVENMSADAYGDLPVVRINTEKC